MDTVLAAQWVIPVQPEGVVLDEHALVIRNGRIIDIRPQGEVRDRYQAQVTLEFAEHVLIPGLINAHTHAGMNLLRGLADDLPLMEWLNDHIWPVEHRWVDEQFTHDSVQLAIAEMLRGGVTCFSDMFYFPDVTARTAAECGMRACVGLIVLDFPTMYARSAEQYLSKGLDVHDQFKNEPLITTALAPHAPYTVSEAPLRRIRLYADELDIPVHMHLHETAQEIKQSVDTFGVRPLARLDELGLVSPSLLAVHMTQLEDEEIERLATARGHVLHCPESNLKLASGFCPVNKLMDAGVNVALGTDGVASNNDLDMFGEMRTAALLAKAVAADATALPAKAALRMATLNGAMALGLADRIGSLEPGKAADVVAVRFDDIETLPLYDPISQLVYATGRDKVCDVWIAGQHVLKDRELITIDAVALKARVRQWNERIMANPH